MPDGAAAGRRIRILTMHGAKGLSGKVVFIPSAEQGVMPSFRAINAAGLLIEARRLFYVSLTRAMAACIVSHAVLREGASALRLAQRPRVRMARSVFLNEMNVQSVRRNGGLTEDEAHAIVESIDNL
jgi:superfamily I DNA/RNA helicase